MADSTLSNLTSLTLPSQATDLLLVGRGTARPNKVAMSDALNSAALAATTAAYGVVLLAPNGGTTAGTVVQANDSRLTGGGGGVTSLAGTANQITASASTGAVTLSLPSTLVLPGTLTGSTITGPATTDLSLAGGSTGATFVLGQGANGGLIGTVVGTGEFDISKYGSNARAKFQFDSTDPTGTVSGTMLRTIGLFAEATAGASYMGHTGTGATLIANTRNSATLGNIDFATNVSGTTTARARLTNSGTLVVNPLYTPTQKLEVQIPHTINTENYLRVASNSGSNTYGAEYGYGLTSVGDPEIRINRVHANTVTNVLKIRTTNGAATLAGSLSITDTTNSTTKTSGALVIGDGTNGGLGVSNAITLGGRLNAFGTAAALTHQLYVYNQLASATNAALSGAQYIAQPGYSTFVGTTGDGTNASYQGSILGNAVLSTLGYVISDAANGLLLHGINGGIRFATNNPGAQVGTISNAGVWNISTSTDSATKSDGALVVSGGVGVGKNIIAGGQLAVSGTGTSGPYLANTAVVDYDSSTARFYGRGPNASTRPSLGFYSTYSDGTGGLTLMTFSAAGAATIDGTLIANAATNAFRIPTAQTPASQTASGTQGQITWDASYLYVCTSTNNWGRSSLNWAGGGGSGGSSNIWIPASEWIPRTTNGCGINSLESTTNRVNYDVLEFDPAAVEYAQAMVVLPNNWNAGTVTAKFHWTAASGSGDVVWQLSGRAYANDDAIDQATGTAQSSTDTLTAANDLDISPATSAITLAGTAANGNPVVFELSRNATAGGDTLGTDARLIGVEITYSV